MNNPAKQALTGAWAGLAATIPMSAMMVWWHFRSWRDAREPLPPSKITHNVLDAVGLQCDSERDEFALTAVNHLAYGATTGAAFGLVVPRNDLVASVNAGIVYGLGVWTASYLGWLPAVGLHESAMEDRAERNLLMLTAHVVWGGSLGLLTGLAQRRAVRQLGKASRPEIRQPAEEMTGV